MVHHVDRVEAGQLGRRGDLAQPGRGRRLRRRANANSPRCSAEPQPGRLVPLALRGRRAPTNGAGTTRTGCGVSTPSKPSAASPSRTAGQSRSCAVSTSAGIRLVAGAVAGPALGGRGVERDGDARHPVRAGPARASCARRAGSSPSVSTTVVQAAPDPHPHHLVEQRERVGARRDVVLAGADQRAQPVAGDDRVGREVRCRPGGLARRTRPDEHDEAGRREVDWLGHRVSPRPG